ncbi:hypothetical protein AL504_31350 [Achromobacter xylosoxidans]|uniref:Uncharacterized protein n=1 Tax=Alcaligenes xylosoxydans xylosoxydans TaxID=85698 RepID=A0A2L0PTH4_ALCXX|nr:hypothetical protein AL504_31350 [Achromobacter xylosoxidans]
MPPAPPTPPVRPPPWPPLPPALRPAPPAPPPPYPAAAQASLGAAEARQAKSAIQTAYATAFSRPTPWMSLQGRARRRRPRSWPLRSDTGGMDAVMGLIS